MKSKHSFRLAQLLVLFVLVVTLAAVAFAQAAGGVLYQRPSAVRSARSTCNNRNHGSLWFSFTGGGGSTDKLQVCTQSTGAAFAWRAVTIGTAQVDP